MIYILDTNVLSEVEKGPRRADANVQEWVRSTDMAMMYISVIAIMEIEMGWRAAQHRNDIMKADRYRKHLDETTAAFKGRILPIDVAVAQACGRLYIPGRKSERDAFIAATAIVHDATVVTRNVADFRATGVSIINPWNT